MALLARVSRWIPLEAAPGAMLLALVVALPCLAIGATVSGAPVTATINFLTLLTAVMALSVFTGNAGVLSFGHVAFMALGAQISATLTLAPALKETALPLLPDWLLQLQLGLWPSLLIAALLVALVAVVVGLPICRLSVSSASIATLGLLIIVNSVLIGAQGYTRGNQAMYGIPRLIDLPTATALGVFAVVFARLFRDSVPGLLLRAARDNEVAAASIGISTTRQRLIAWVASAVLASIAGVMFAHFLTVFSAKEFFFDQTFAILVMLVVGGMASVTGGVAGAMLVTIAIEILRRLENGFEVAGLAVPQVFGLTEVGLSLIIIATLYWRRTGLIGFAELDHLLRRFRPRPPAVDRDALAPSRALAGRLSLAGIGKTYGSLVAVEAVDLELATGEILGLIGPNGSGKTTLLGCVAGTHRPTTGRVHLDGQDITGRTAHRVARLGIARTFQTMRLFTRLTALENVMAALAQRRRELSRSALRAAALELLRELKVAELAERPAGTLAYGQQRRVEIARALATEPRFMLLDEPAAGMNEAETLDLLEILRWLVEARGLGLLIVDHDMQLIMRLCPRIAVLNKGQLIALGSPQEVQGNPAVLEAYLGRRHAERLIA